MAKELPYFRFTPQEWQNGKISLESYELKGLFIDICSYYWINDCSITQAMLKKRFRNDIELIDELLEYEIFTIENNTDFVVITFLNEQFDILSEARKRRQEAGSKGGKKSRSNAQAMLKQCSSYKDKDKDKDKDKYKDKDKDKDNNKFTPPTLQEVIDYFLEKGYKKEIAEKMHEYYNVAEWKDSRGTKIKNWKQKANSVWFKENAQEKRKEYALDSIRKWFENSDFGERLTIQKLGVFLTNTKHIKYLKVDISKNDFLKKTDLINNHFGKSDGMYEQMMRFDDEHESSFKGIVEKAYKTFGL